MLRGALKYDAWNLFPKISVTVLPALGLMVEKLTKNHIKMIPSRIKIIYIFKTFLGAFPAHSQVSKYRNQEQASCLGTAATSLAVLISIFHQVYREILTLFSRRFR